LFSPFIFCVQERDTHLENDKKRIEKSCLPVCLPVVFLSGIRNLEASRWSSSKKHHSRTFSVALWNSLLERDGEKKRKEKKREA
jgi:hypothetical protein